VELRGSIVESYSQFLTREVFPCVEGKRVLEIGSLTGRITEEIRKHTPLEITTIDPDPMVRKQTTFSGTANDYFNYYCFDQSATNHLSRYDVVVLMGVLYHLHSPLHLLEMIINKIRPEMLIIETATGEPYHVAVDTEYSGTIGNAWPDKGIEYPIRTNINFSTKDLIATIETTPMKLRRKVIYEERFDNWHGANLEQDSLEHSKQGMWIGHFQWRN
jgi:SAM-dependent methyltransferase